MAQLLRTASPKCSQELLLFAIKSKNATAVAYLAEALDASCFDSALKVATTTAHLPCLDALLSSGKTDPNVRDVDGGLPLHAACVSGALPIVQRLYAVTTTTHILDDLGNTPLHLASMGGHVAVVEFLIRSGADINASNEGLDTPLDLAIINGETAVQKLLLENGARLDGVDESTGALHDANRMMGMDNSFQSLFEVGTELANPFPSDDLKDFDFDSFLRDQDEDYGTLYFAEAFPMEGDSLE
ncbi:Uncharacterized protein LW94_1180 [Fusarium fujikuroi]|nr:Uncharacterized protein LW94_1180 [Fusarium fujikuroi]